jgi:hypothetical protein
MPYAPTWEQQEGREGGRESVQTRSISSVASKLFTIKFSYYLSNDASTAYHHASHWVDFTSTTVSLISDSCHPFCCNWLAWTRQHYTLKLTPSWLHSLCTVFKIHLFHQFKLSTSDSGISHWMFFSQHARPQSNPITSIPKEQSLRTHLTLIFKEQKLTLSHPNPESLWAQTVFHKISSQSLF